MLSPEGLAEIDTPALLVDRAVLERNIARMRDLAAKAGVAYRPHAKTHKTPIVARMQLEAGASGICCAKLGEAEVMAEAGIPDILVTSEIVGPIKIARLMAAARKAKIGVVVDNERHVAELATATAAAGLTLDVFVEVDIGQGRCGVAPGPEAVRLAKRIAAHPGLRFKGLQGYQGKLQMMPSYAERAEAVERSLALLNTAVAAVRGAGIEIATVTGGGTGSSILDAALGGYSELQPGSYVFMDSRYRAIEWDGGGAPPFECALTLLATVVSRPDAHRAIIDAGYKTVSMDSGSPVAAAYPAAAFTFGGDEHGQLDFGAVACPLAVGDRVILIPSHCDTTVNLHDRYVVIRGGAPETVWKIAARGQSR